MTSIALKSRYRGTLVCVLLGDAIAAPYETWDTKSVAVDLEKRGGLTFFEYPDPWEPERTFPPGRPTDDSELTAALALSLITCQGGDYEDQYRRFKQPALEQKSYLWDGRAVGFGKTTKKTLAAVTLKESLGLGDLPFIPSNGSLMRSSPLPLAFRGFPTVLTTETIESSKVTHRHPLAIECCVVYVHYLSLLLDGQDPKTAWENLPSRLRNAGLTEPALIEMVGRRMERPSFPEKDTRGAALLTLQIAVWATLNSESVEEGITLATLFGGDTDTYAAVAGGLLGAHYGAAIPLEWKGKLLGYDKMVDLADRLYALSCENN